MRIGSLTINPRSREVRVSGRLVELRRKEYEFLTCLAAAPTRVFGKDELLHYVWHYPVGSNPNTRVLDSYASRVRKVLNAAGDEQFVHNIWGVGYRLTDPPIVDPDQAVDGDGSRWLITETQEYLVNAHSEQEARALFLEGAAGAPIGLVELLVQEAGG